jgi:N-acetylmuramic acid 6-phosphate etherase
MMSTLMAMRMGHVHDGMMVNVRADNDKLRARAHGIVARIAKVTEARAAQALIQANGQVKLAIMLAIAGLSPDDASKRLNDTQGNLRNALDGLPRSGRNEDAIQTSTE